MSIDQSYLYINQETPRSGRLATRKKWDFPHGKTRYHPHPSISSSVSKILSNLTPSQLPPLHRPNRPHPIFHPFANTPNRKPHFHDPSYNHPKKYQERYQTCSNRIHPPFGNTSANFDGDPLVVAHAIDKDAGDDQTKDEDAACQDADVGRMFSFLFVELVDEGFVDF